MKLAMTLGVLTLALPLGATATFAQEAPKGYMPGRDYKLPGVVITAAQIETMKKNMIGKKAIDVPINMVDMSGAQAGVSLVIRYKGSENNPVLHDLVSEVYHILEGSGTLLIGGELVNPARRPFSRGNGPGMSAESIKGGQTIKVAKGDVLMVPAGTPHQTLSVEEQMVYTVTRLDATKATPLQETSTVVPDTSNTGGR